MKEEAQRLEYRRLFTSLIQSLPKCAWKRLDTWHILYADRRSPDMSYGQTL